MRWVWPILLALLRDRTALGQRLCQSGWLYVNDKCWKYEQEPLPFDQAARKCAQQNSELASIHNDEENRFTYSLIERHGLPSPSARRPFARRRRLQDRDRDSRFGQPSPGRIFFAQVPTDVSCFNLVSNAVLFGFTEVAIQKPNADACKRECIDSNRLYSFECFSIMYYPETSDCLLNSKNRFDPDAADLFQIDSFGERVDYYDNNCRGGVGPTTRPPFTGGPRVEGCFRVWEDAILVGYADEVIDGITLGECQTECTEAIDTYGFPCNSFMYYRDRQTCIINEVTKDDFPALFTSDDKADYYEQLDRCPEDMTTPSPRVCVDRKMDLMFVVDGSGSIGPQSFEDIRRFLNLVVDELDVGFNDSNVGLVQFNENPFTEFSLREYQTNSEVRRDRPTVPNVVIVLTDGLSQDDPSPAAQQMRALGMETYAIGITEAVFDEQLLAIAGTPDRVYKVSDFTQLDRNLRNAIVRQICPGDNPNPVIPPVFPFPTQRPPLFFTPAPVFFTPRPPTRTYGGGYNGVWIGMKKNYGQGQSTSGYQWTDRTQQDYVNWRFGQPDSRPDQTCVVSEFEPLQRWSNSDCRIPRAFICKRPPPSRLKDTVSKVSRAKLARYMNLRKRLLTRAGIQNRRGDGWVRRNVFNQG